MIGLEQQTREKIVGTILSRSYRAIDLDAVVTYNPLTLAQEESLAAADVVIMCADARSRTSCYWSGVVSARATPAIALTFNSEYPYRADFPKEFQPRIANAHDASSLEAVISTELDLYEQNFLSAQEPEVIERYVRMQVRAGSLAGNYEASTRQVFIGAIMGDQYNVSGQSGAIGREAHAHDISFNQVWSQLSHRIDLPVLAEELARLRDAMGREAKEPEHFASAGTIAAAEASARQGNGPKALEYLKLGGKWALGVAEKIGVDIAKEALKGAMGI